MDFVPERTDAYNKFAVHTDGKYPFTAYGGPWNATAQWLEIDGDVPDSERLAAALETFPWRDGKDMASPCGSCMISTPMDGVFLEVMPRNHVMDRFGFSVSGTVHDLYFAEVEAEGEAKFPGRARSVERVWSDDEATRSAAFAAPGEDRVDSPRQVPFETAVKNGVRDALNVSLKALNASYKLVPADVVEHGLDEAEVAACRTLLTAPSPWRP